MRHGVQIMDPGGLCIPGQHYGSVFEEEHFLDTGGDAGDEMGAGGRGKGEKGTMCGAASSIVY